MASKEAQPGLEVRLPEGYQPGLETHQPVYSADAKHASATMPKEYNSSNNDSYYGPRPPQSDAISPTDTEATTRNDRRILGLRPVTFWLSLALALVVILAAALGGELGAGMKSKNNSTSDTHHRFTSHRLNRDIYRQTNLHLLNSSTGNPQLHSRTNRSLRPKLLPTQQQQNAYLRINLKQLHDRLESLLQQLLLHWWERCHEHIERPHRITRGLHRPLRQYALAGKHQCDGQCDCVQPRG